MPLSRIDHVTIRCRDLARSRKFYADALGLIDGDRPPFDFPGAWLWLDGRAVVHLLEDREMDAAGTGRFDHVAFAASDLAAARSRLDALGISYRERAVPGLPLHQMFFYDPDGIAIELNVAVD